MKKRHAFRPSLSNTDVLEDRIVMSHAHVAVAAHPRIQPFQGINLGLIQSQINAAFTNFALDYSQAQSAYLSPTAGTTASTSTDLQNFIPGRISTLVQQVNGILGSIPGSNASSIGSITAPLYGSALGTLQQRLQSINPVGVNGQTAATYAQQAASAIELGRSVTVQSFQILGNMANMNLYGQYQSQFTGSSHAHLSRAQLRQISMMNQATAQIQQTFNNFLGGFANARNNVLFNSGTGTGAGTSTGNTLDLTSNLSQFNSQLSNGLIGLANSLSGSLANLRNTANTFQPAIVQAIFGTGAGNTGLLGQFSNMQAPTDLSGLSAQQFNNQTFSLLNNVYSNIQGRLNTFQANPNFNFSSYNQFTPTSLGGGGNSDFFTNGLNSTSGGQFTPTSLGGGGNSLFFTNGLFSPPTTYGNATPTFYNGTFTGGLGNNSFNSRSFGTGFGGSPTFALGYGMNGFNTFYGSGQNSVGSGSSNFGNGFGGSFVTTNPSSGFGGGFFGTTNYGYGYPGTSAGTSSPSNGNLGYTGYGTGYYGGSTPAATFSNGYGPSSTYTPTTTPKGPNYYTTPTLFLS